jgi:hypothetical protein
MGEGWEERLVVVVWFAVDKTGGRGGWKWRLGAWSVGDGGPFIGRTRWDGGEKTLARCGEGMRIGEKNDTASHTAETGESITDKIFIHKA